MNDTLYLFCGKSASGKSTIANILEEKYGVKQVRSYTTRKPRYDGEDGHVFVDADAFEKLGKLAAYTFYNGNHYGVTYDQLEQCDVYVIDPFGVKVFLKNFNDSRPIRVIYFDAAVSTRINRMIDRGASDYEIISRLLTDDTKDNWGKELDSLVWNYFLKGQDVEFYEVDANADVEDVLEQVLYRMDINKDVEG